MRFRRLIPLFNLLYYTGTTGTQSNKTELQIRGEGDELFDGVQLDQ